MYLRKIGRQLAFALIGGYMVVVRADSPTMWLVVGILALWAGSLAFELWRERESVGPALKKLPAECAAAFAFRKRRSAACPYAFRRILRIASRVFAVMSALASAAGLGLYWIGDGRRSGTVDAILAASLVGFLAVRIVRKRRVSFCRRSCRAERIGR